MSSAVLALVRNRLVCVEIFSQIGLVLPYYTAPYLYDLVHISLCWFVLEKFLGKKITRPFGRATS